MSPSVQGLDEGPDGIRLISDIIREKLDMDVSVLMGANIASEVADNKFCESTVGETSAAPAAVLLLLLLCNPHPNCCCMFVSKILNLSLRSQNAGKRADFQGAASDSQLPHHSGGGERHCGAVWSSEGREASSSSSSSSSLS